MPARALAFARSIAIAPVTDRRVARARGTGDRSRTHTRALGGFGPNIDAETIKKIQAAKAAKIAENKRRASETKGKFTFGDRRESQRTIASVPSRAGRTTPGGSRTPAKTPGKTPAKTRSSEKEETPRKKLFGLF